MAYDAFVDSVQLNSALTATANAIRSKTGDTSSISFNLSTGFADAISSIGGGSGLDEFLETNFTSSYENSTVSAIGRGKFAYQSSLTNVSFASCTFVDSYAFASCSYLGAAYFSVCTIISSYAFYYCSRMSVVSMPLCLTIGSSAFAYCSSLTTVSFNSCQRISAYAFNRCYKLSSVSFPACSTIGTYAFNYCSSLNTVRLSACTTISSYAFASCYNLLSLYLLGSSIVSISTSTFSSTPIAGYTTSTGGVYGSVYVPSSLLSSYKTATNWSSISNRLVGI